jgi:hypothetical protein
MVLDFLNKCLLDKFIFLTADKIEQMRQKPQWIVFLNIL